MMIIVSILAVIGALCIAGAIAFTAWCYWHMRYYYRRIARQSSQAAREWQRFRAGELPSVFPDGMPETEQIEAIGLFVAGKIDPIGRQKGEAGK